MLIYCAVPLFFTTGIQVSFETSLVNFDAVNISKEHVFCRQGHICGRIFPKLFQEYF